MSKLQGKVAVITGGSSGIGLATAKRFVEEGAYVFITGRRQEELDKAVAHIGSNVTAVQGDVTSLADLDRLYEKVKQTKGVVDVLVANAGFIELKTIDEIDSEHFDKTFSINAKGLLFTVQKALPLMRRGGSIIVTSSIASVKAIPQYGTYSATKAALRSFVRTWTLELKERGIRVNTLSPGPVETPIIDKQFSTREESDKMREMFAQLIPLGRMGRPEELAAAALFLASDESSFVAGIDLPVDGGMAQI
jgi:NAD(P)-dependent dehydrogenase (short-subunit alcohol dehydrogenase family)